GKNCSSRNQEIHQPQVNWCNRDFSTVHLRLASHFLGIIESVYSQPYCNFTANKPVGFKMDVKGDPPSGDRLPVEGLSRKPYIALSMSFIETYTNCPEGSTIQLLGLSGVLKGDPATAVRAPLFLSTSKPSRGPS